MLASFATVVAIGLLARTASAQCGRSYTVAVGDYCDTIAARQNVPTFQLFANNPSIDKQCSNLETGQVLCLGFPGQDCTDVHVVVLGDTCSSVEAAAGIDTTLFYANNPQLDDRCSNLYVGEVVCVSKKVQVPNVPDTKSIVPPAPVNPAPAPPPPTTSSMEMEPTPPVAPAAPPPPVAPAAPPPPVAPAAPSPPVAPAAPPPTDSTSASDASPTPTPDDQLPFCDEM